jgi:hypothetical protein
MANDNDILEYRPTIAYDEPDAKPGDIDPYIEESKHDAQISLQTKAKSLAKSVNALATAIQARVDLKAAEAEVKLDKNTDAAIIASMKRMFGHDAIDPTVITYEQYKSCKERMRKKGEELGQRTAITPESLNDVQQKIESSGVSLSEFTGLGKAGTPEARNGGLRPELQKDGQLIEPIDVAQLQAYLVRIFVNAVWGKFLLPIFEQVPGMEGILPDQLAEIPPDGYSAQELVNLGIPVIGYEKSKADK